jgi:hypothetical protein
VSATPPGAPDDAFVDVLDAMEHHAARLRQTMRGEPGKDGAFIVDAGKFDGAMIELMRYVHGRLPPSMAHAGIAALVRGILEGCGVIDCGELS